MAQPYIVAVEGISDAVASLAEMPDAIQRYARMAINTTTRKTRTAASRRIREQVNFTAGYLSGNGGRLTISQQATDGNLEARIRGRFRPTSLARFASGAIGRSGVRVRVSPGATQRMGRAFLMRLRAGRANIETKSNLGLAIRLKPGEHVENKHRMVPVTGNLYLLFGPSVDQIFRSVAEELAPDAADDLQTEFLRLIDRMI